MGIQKKHFAKRLLSTESGFGVMYSILACLCVIVFTAPAAHAEDHVLDRVDLGSSDSEAAHNFETKGSKVIDYSDLPKPDVRITDVTASVNERKAVKTIDGGMKTRWGALSDEIWVQYKLSETIELDRVEIARRDAAWEFPFDIKVSTDGEQWEQVFNGKSSVKGEKEFEKFTFDPVTARYVRIVSHGVGRVHGNQNWLWEVRIGDLSWPDAYERAATLRALGETGRRMRKDSKLDNWGLNEEDLTDNWMEFHVAVDPEEQNYISLKIWGSQQSSGNLALLMGHETPGAPYRWISIGTHKRQFGNQHFPYKRLWRGDSWTTRGAPYPDRWIYRTYPLPEEITTDQEQVRLRIQQIEVAGSSPTLYTIYSHTGSYFRPPSDQPQGEPFQWGPAREKPDGFSPEKKLKKEAQRRIKRVVTNQQKGNLNNLAEIYHTGWSRYYNDERLLRWAIETLDAKAKQFDKNGNLGKKWAAAGREIARAYVRLHEEFEDQEVLDEHLQLPDDGENIPRRQAYARMFKGEFDRFHKRRRAFTNQTYYGNAGLYFLNRALLKLKPELAIPEQRARWFVYEILGMVPFSPDTNWQRGWGGESMEAGFPLHVVTDKGLTRERGYVGGYGEMTHQLALLAEDIGDPSLKERVAEMMKARAHFRVPDNTAEGYRTLRGIELIGWRHRNYPAKIRYGYYDAITEAAVLKDPVSLRLAELFLKHGHHYDWESYLDHGRWVRHLWEFIRHVEHFRTVKELLPVDYRLPFEQERDEYAWADEQNGVFMIHHKDSFIYGSLYWPPAQHGVNPNARLYHRTSLNDRIVDAQVDTRVPDTGTFYEISPDEEVGPPLRMPAGHKAVIEGRKLKVAPPPPGTEWPPVEHRKGRAWFYQLNYGNYLIGMNTTGKDAYNATVYELNVPEEHQGKTVKDLLSGRTVDLSEPVVLGPRSTMVLYLGGN